jgi:two-component sensor histidine kinase
MTLYDLVNHSRESIDKNIEIIEKKKGYFIGQRDYLRKTGDVVPVEVSVNLIEVSNGKVMSVVARDISERKKAEEKIITSLREKELLLQEIHHRVKNNLQIVSSMLSLQANKSRDKEIQELFNKSQNRLRTMALIHDNLYRSKDFTLINVRKFIKILTDQLYKSYNKSYSMIKINLNIEDITLDINKMIPCGLILNELITNSLKHAFPDNRDGEIYITFSFNNGYLMTVKDNGVGLEKNFDVDTQDSLGIQLVKRLVGQLRGSLEILFSQGIQYNILFK